MIERIVAGCQTRAFEHIWLLADPDTAYEAYFAWRKAFWAMVEVLRDPVLAAAARGSVLGPPEEVPHGLA